MLGSSHVVRTGERELIMVRVYHFDIATDP